MKTERGFALAMVMMLTVATAAIVIGSMRDMVLQERLTGNFQKTIAARHAAEKGVFDATVKLNEALEENPDITLEELLVAGTLTGTAADGSTYAVQASINEDGLLEIRSVGSNEYGKSALVARFRFVKNAVTADKMVSGIVACDSVTASGNARIDSWDFSKGNYDRSAVEPKDGSSHSNLLKVIGKFGTLTLNDNAVIWGNVQNSGDAFVQGQAIVYGDLRSGGNVTIASKPQDNSSGNLYSPYTTKDPDVSVWGDVMANGNFLYKGSRIYGGGRVNGDVDVDAARDNSHKIYNQGRYSGGGIINYGGDASLSGGLGWPPELVVNGLTIDDDSFRLNPNLPAIPFAYSSMTDHRPPADFEVNEATLDQTCEPIPLDQIMKALRPTWPVRDISWWTAQKGVRIEPQGAFIGYSQYLSQEATLPTTGEKVSIVGISYYNMNSGGGTLTVQKGDSILFPTGSIALNNAQINLDQDSSLTIYSYNVSKFLDVKVRTVGGFEGGRAKLQLLIYSSQAELRVSGDTEVYAFFYLPKGRLIVEGNAHVKGFVRAHNITIKDNGKITADVALISAPAGGGRLVFDGFVFE